MQRKQHPHWGCLSAHLVCIILYTPGRDRYDVYNPVMIKVGSGGWVVPQVRDRRPRVSSLRFTSASPEAALTSRMEALP